MTITVTFREIMNRGVWDAFCKLKGINVWCMSEGLADSETTAILLEEEAQELGLIPGDPHD